MSFSTDLKTEIIENKSLRSRYKKAQAYGLFLFSKSFSASSVEISTENAETANLFISFLHSFLGRRIKIVSAEKSKNGKLLYTAVLSERVDRERLLAFFMHGDSALNREILPEHEQIAAFLSGAYLACGNLTDPNKGYHIEYVVKSEALCGALKALHDEVLPGAKMTVRRGRFVLYYKEYAQIEDLITLIGAPKSCLAMIEIEMMKGVRNSANRATNCETANIDKLVAASTSQIEDITLLIDKIGEGNLPDNLRSIARLRLENPEASLRELSEISSPRISRSGIYHRLDKIAKMADEIRFGEDKSG